MPKIKLRFEITNRGTPLLRSSRLEPSEVYSQRIKVMLWLGPEGEVREPAIVDTGSPISCLSKSVWGRLPPGAITWLRTEDDPRESRVGPGTGKILGREYRTRYGQIMARAVDIYDFNTRLTERLVLFTMLEDLDTPKDCFAQGAVVGLTQSILCERDLVITSANHQHKAEAFLSDRETEPESVTSLPSG